MRKGFSTQSNDPKAIYKEWLCSSEAIPPSKTKKILAKKLLLALSIIGTIMGFCLLMAGFFSDFAVDAAAERRKGTQGTLSEDDPVTWLKDIEEYKKHGSDSILSRVALADKQQTASPAKTAAEEKKVEVVKTPKEETLAQVGPRSRATVVARHERTEPRAPVLNPSDPWGQIYGSTPRNKNVSNTFNTTTSENPKAATDSSKGARLAVKLKGSAASNPSGPVVAVLLKDANLAGRDLPRGTEIHGETRGAGPGARLMMTFTSIRSKDGSSLKFSGRAIATDGRMGVVGTQTLGGGTDIAASALGAGVRAGGNVVASLVGSNPLGAAIDGAMSPVSDKARRLDYEEDAVVLNSGARFDIYVDEV